MCVLRCQVHDQAPCNIRSLCVQGVTPLAIAACGRYKPLTELLLTRGANPSPRIPDVSSSCCLVYDSDAPAEISIQPGVLCDIAF